MRRSGGVRGGPGPRRPARSRRGAPAAGRRSGPPSRARRSSRRARGRTGTAPSPPDHVEDAGADRSRRDQREERDRQGDHEREQRARPDLLRRRRRSRRRRRRRRRHRRRSRPGPEREAPPVDREQRRAPPSSSSVTANDATTPEPDLLASRPVCATSPRVSRAKAFSSRSSASEPATSSTVTNISVIVAATAIANVPSSALRPSTTSLSTLIGVRDRAEQRRRGAEVLASEVGELDHLVERRPRVGLVGGSSVRTCAGSGSVCSSPRMSRSPASGS